MAHRAATLDSLKQHSKVNGSLSDKLDQRAGGNMTEILTVVAFYNTSR